MIFSPLYVSLTFWQQIQPVDRWLITHINQNWSSPFLDSVIPYLRETLTWIPLYLFLFFLAIFNFRGKAWWWIMGAVLTAALSDLVSSRLIKENIIRIRPCQDAEVSQLLRFFI